MYAVLIKHNVMIYTMSWNQNNFNLCSPSTLIFSYAKIVNYLFTKKRLNSITLK